MAVTKRENINVRAREIDFVSRFQNQFQALQELLGITRPIKKEPGTTLKTLKAGITLENGYVPEGAQIPYSTATVTEAPLTDLTLEKYLKGVTIEAINKYGYDVAVAKTDEALINQLQADVMGRFYGFLQSGALVSNESTFQLALAMAKGNVLNAFKAMNKTVTEVVGFVNVLDFYEYLGTANITVQTMFGMQYVKDFMGYGTIFLEDGSKIPRGKVIATPVDNIVLYYTNPADSAFANAGLNYTVVGETNIIGVHIEGNYGTAVSDIYALMGMVMYAEYLDGIAVVTIGTEVTPTLTAKTGTIFGKAVSDLQDVTISNGVIKGVLKAQDETFAGFDLEKGDHFLAVQFGSVTADKVEVGLYPSQGAGMVELDSDNDAVLQVASAGQIMMVKTTVSGVANVKSYALSGLVLE